MKNSSGREEPAVDHLPMAQLGNCFNHFFTPAPFHVFVSNYKNVFALNCKMYLAQLGHCFLALFTFTFTWYSFTLVIFLHQHLSHWSCGNLSLSQLHSQFLQHGCFCRVVSLLAFTTRMVLPSRVLRPSLSVSTGALPTNFPFPPSLSQLSAAQVLTIFVGQNIYTLGAFVQWCHCWLHHYLVLLLHFQLTCHFLPSYHRALPPDQVLRNIPISGLDGLPATLECD